MLDRLNAGSASCSAAIASPMAWRRAALIRPTRSGFAGVSRTSSVNNVTPAVGPRLPRALVTGWS